MAKHSIMGESSPKAGIKPATSAGGPSLYKVIILISLMALVGVSIGSNFRNVYNYNNSNNNAGEQQEQQQLSSMIQQQLNNLQQRNEQLSESLLAQVGAMEKQLSLLQHQQEELGQTLQRQHDELSETLTTSISSLRGSNIGITSTTHSTFVNKNHTLDKDLMDEL